MAPNDDLRGHATSAFDFYDLLSLSPNFAQKDLDRARRLTSFKYHPDKVGDDASAREKLHMTNVGYEILNDPQLRALYDNARSARERKKASEAHLEAGRRKLKEELEAREFAGAKANSNIIDPRTSLSEQDQKLAWIAQDGKRRRLELQTRLEREHKAEVERQQSVTSSVTTNSQTTVTTSADIPELERSVKVEFVDQHKSLNLTSEHIETLFSRFGKVDSAFCVNSKRSKHPGKPQSGKRTAYVVFTDQRSATIAVRGWQQASLDPATDQAFWQNVENASWAGGEEPEGLPAKTEQDSNGLDQATPELGTKVPSRSTENPFEPKSQGEQSLEAQALSVLRDAARMQASKAV